MDSKDLNIVDGEEVDPNYWYLNRSQLEPGQVFKSCDGSLVKLDGRVPGDGTRWNVAEWDNGWFYMKAEVEPGDLRGEPLEDPAAAKTSGDSNTDRTHDQTSSDPKVRARFEREVRAAADRESTYINLDTRSDGTYRESATRLAFASFLAGAAMVTEKG